MMAFSFAPIARSEESAQLVSPFLDRGVNRAEIWADAATPVANAQSEERVNATGSLQLHRAANGGAVVRLWR